MYDESISKYSKKEWDRIENKINRRAWKRTYKDSRFMNHSKILERTYSRLNSSSYWYDFTASNLKSFCIIFLFLICVCKAVLWIESSNANPFEDGISVLQEFSDMGETGKNVLVNFTKSLLVIGNSKEILGDTSSTLGGLPIQIGVNNFLTRLITSVGYAIATVWNLIIFIIRCVLVILRVLVGGV